MKTFLRNLLTLDNLLSFGDFLLKWTLLFLATGVFVLCSMMISKVIDGNVWIIFAADLVFCWLFWMFMSLSKYLYSRLLYMRKAVTLMISMIIIFIMIAMATFGLSVRSMYSSIAFSNILVFPILVFTTLALWLNNRHKNNFSRPYE